MKIYLVARWPILAASIAGICFMFFIAAAPAVPAAQAPFAEKGLFESDAILNLTLKGNLRNLLNDKSDNPKNFPLVLSYSNENNNQLDLPVEVKTRGHFRRVLGNCTYPPLLIQFPKEGSHLSSIFKEQRKLKLVMPCKGDEYIIREWLAYKIYNLVTPKSFRTRLVKVTLEDTRTKKTASSFYGILLEEESQMAKRNNLIAVEKKLQPQQTQQTEFLTMAVFQYLIGNTDWSIQYMQNIKLLAKDETAVPFAVPYDFDHAGIVSAPYALPPEELHMISVRQRRYRGYCVNELTIFEPVIAHYNQLKPEIYKLFTNCSFIDEKYLKTATKYLDEFYTTINTTKAWQKEFAYPCDKTGTGNVIIKGLKED
ncbi:hypothetical protein [Lacibacter sp. H407]|uniref:hypothetical protein n=1 Tax=Lacibacter sp. H407 TaxID=3133423 RepID=UPI0030C4552E